MVLLRFMCTTSVPEDVSRPIITTMPNPRCHAPTVPAGATVAARTILIRASLHDSQPRVFLSFQSDSKSKGRPLPHWLPLVTIGANQIDGDTGRRIWLLPYRLQGLHHGYYLGLLRNHDYRIEVESIEAAAQTAYEAPTRGNHTLKCKIVPWNEVKEGEGDRKQTALGGYEVYICAQCTGLSG